MLVLAAPPPIHLTSKLCGLLLVDQVVLQVPWLQQSCLLIVYFPIPHSQALFQSLSTPFDLAHHVVMLLLVPALEVGEQTPLQVPSPSVAPYP